MAKFNVWASLAIMATGVIMSSTAIVICGFVATNIWVAADEIIKAMKND